MSNWRPKGWDESAEATAKGCAGDKKFKESTLEVIIRGMFEAGADAMLKELSEEIEKGLLTDEESYALWLKYEEEHPLQDVNWEQVLVQAQLQKILTLFKK